jgi:tetratricopeptide (TPR) repeat protein
MSARLTRSAFVALLFSSAVSYGQAAPPAASTSARAHFDEGLGHVAHGQFDLALQEFEAAYALKPHFSVLYNIGQAEAALGRPAEAAQAFERYLVEGGNRIAQARRDEVRALIATNRARLGELQLLGTSDAIRVWVDGLEIDKQRLSQPLLLPGGKHSVLSSDGGAFPVSQEVQVIAASSVELRLLPQATRATAPDSPPAVAQLRVVCDLAGVNVEVDGTHRATTPVRHPLTVGAGPLTVRFSRPGYQPVIQHLAARPNGSTVALCDQLPQRDLASAVKATLVVQPVPSDATIFVDGDRFLGAPLPYGPHELRVESPGFIPQSRAISLRPRDVTTYEVRLEPTPSRRAEQSQAQAGRKMLGYASTGGGIALGILGSALLAWNGNRYESWKRERASASPSLQLQPVASIQRVDDIAIGCTALGAGLVATGVWLLLTRPTDVSSH